MTINLLAKTLLKLSRRGEQGPIYEPSRHGEIRHSQADIKRLVRHLGFRPVISLEEDLQRIVNDMRLGSR